MKFDMRKPCPRCPFRSDITQYLTSGRCDEILTAITDQQQTFSCHKTIETVEDDDGNTDTRSTSDSQHCAGALILLEHEERPNQMMRIMERLGFYDRTKLDMDSPVYESVEDMQEAHDDAEKKRRRR